MSVNHHRPADVKIVALCGDVELRVGDTVHRSLVDGRMETGYLALSAEGLHHDLYARAGRGSMRHKYLYEGPEYHLPAADLEVAGYVIITHDGGVSATPIFCSQAEWLELP